MKIDSIKMKIALLLLKYPSYRDSDTRLCAHLIMESVKEQKIYSDEEQVTIRKFLENYAAKKYPQPPTIKRVRAKLQEDNICLQGEEYMKRHGIDVKKTQSDLYNKDWTIKDIIFGDKDEQV